MSDEYIDIQLDTVRTYRNAQEYRDIPRASWKGMQVASDGWVIKLLCKQIADANPQIKGHVRVFRHDIPVFNPMPLKQWLKRDPFSTGNQPEHLKRGPT